jgi:hypothetical protein
VEGLERPVSRATSRHLSSRFPVVCVAALSSIIFRLVFYLLYLLLFHFPRFELA